MNIVLPSTAPIKRAAPLVRDRENADVVWSDSEHDAVTKLTNEFPANLLKNDWLRLGDAA